MKVTIEGSVSTVCGVPNGRLFEAVVSNRPAPVVALKSSAGGYVVVLGAGEVWRLDCGNDKSVVEGWQVTRVFPVGTELVVRAPEC